MFADPAGGDKRVRPDVPLRVQRCRCASHCVREERRV